MIRDKRRFNIGEPVRITKQVVRCIESDAHEPKPFSAEDDSRTWVRWQRTAMPEPAAGVVVGIGCKVSGELKQGASFEAGWGAPPEPSANYIDGMPEPFWLVRLGVENKPLLVDDRDIKLARAMPVLPLRYSRQPPWTDGARQAYRDAVKDAPRDKKGRFAKEVKK